MSHRTAVQHEINADIGFQSLKPFLFCNIGFLFPIIHAKPFCFMQEYIQRGDDEACMFHLQCLEEMNERLVMSSDAREMLHNFPPSIAVPALCSILNREVTTPT